MSQSSVIGAGTTVHGSIAGEGSLEILGRVEGDVEMSGDVSVADGGAVRGNVTGKKISVQGAVQGDLRGTEAVLLERGAKVVGDLIAPRIGIGNGALVRGSVRTEGELSLSAPNKRPAPAALKPTAFAAKPVAKAEPKLAPAPPPPAPTRIDENEDEDDDRGDEPVLAAPPPPRPQEVERRPPPPVLPSLGKGAKGKKKGQN